MFDQVFKRGSHEVTVKIEFCESPTELQYSVYRKDRVMSALVIRDIIQTSLGLILQVLAQTLWLLA